ncbi:MULTISPECIES: MFS transporter [unclassified Fusibacter]|uniref:MFS transporter n=1 Tax=unclassified Fusibacter TaxID=2624464 RepID=UPI0010116D5B|nr:MULTISPECIES: MFS transporter [unclassified Fusibacter]MCK8061621.1 MFS transporter [Fusibacter sp. A2]NPE23804.1 hypothetical protein [Fusibacter sp. A1]RXV58642.1 hypothetical protein DWB64_18630 [Fusibacter sp. A1]
MSGIKSKIKKGYYKVFTSRRLTFSGRLSMAFPQIPMLISNLLMQTVMFKYFTDIVGINPILVGGVFLGLAIWNSINDPIVGFMLDRMPYIKNKGKYVLIMRVAFPMIALSTLALLFVSSEWKDGLIFIYILLMFIVYEAAMTAYDISYESYLFVRLRDSVERLEMSILRTYLSYIVSALITLIPLLMFVGDKPRNGITFIVALAITVNALFYWVTLRRLTDHHKYYSSDQSNEGAQVFKEMFVYTKDIIKLKGFWVINVMKYLIILSTTYYFTYFLYFMDDVVNATEGQTIFIDIAASALAFLVVPFIPSIHKRLGLKMAFFAAMIPGIIGFGMLYFTSNVYLAGLMFALIVVSHGSIETLYGPTANLVADEDWQNTGVRKYGFIKALQGLINKPAHGIRSMVFGAILGFYGYNGTAEVQSLEAIKGIRMASSILPMIALVLGMFLILFLPYTKSRENEIITKRRILEIDAEKLYAEEM